MTVPPVRVTEDCFPPGVDPALIDWAHRLQAQGFVPELPDQPSGSDIAVEELAFDPDQPYDPFQGWQQELPAVNDIQEEPDQVVPADDGGYEADDEAEDGEEDPEEDPAGDDFWVADPAPEDPDEGAVAVADLFPGAPEAPGHPFPGLPEPQPDFPPEEDMGEVVDPDPEGILTVSDIRAQRDALMAQQGTDWVRIQELEDRLAHMRRQRDIATQQWAEERARAGRAEQVAAISGQAVRRMTVRMEEDAPIAVRELDLSDQEFQAHIEQTLRMRAERRHRAQQKAPVRRDWGEGTSRQGGQG